MIMQPSTRLTSPANKPDVGEVEGASAPAQPEKWCVCVWCVSGQYCLYAIASKLQVEEQEGDESANNWAQTSVHKFRVKILERDKKGAAPKGEVVLGQLHCMHLVDAPENLMRAARCEQ